MNRIAALLVLALAGGCSEATLNRIDPPLPQNANTQRVCWDGTTCPNYLDCPNYASPGTCGGPVFDGPADVGMKLSLDAGADAR
jgi:hypothetical protein